MTIPDEYTFGVRVGTLLRESNGDENLKTLQGIPREKDTVPPFWPTLVGDNEFTITDGFVVDMEGGITNTDCLNKYYPTGIGTIGGDRAIVAIQEGDYIYIKCVIDYNGVCITQTLKTDPADKLSFNPNPVDQDPADPDLRTNGEFWFKIAQCVADANSQPTFIHHLAGSHIYLRHRGGNLDLKVKEDTISGGTISNPFNNHHFLVFRNGLYIGRFDSDAVKPTHVGQLDTDTVTYLS